MVVTAVTQAASPAGGRLRPLNPARDLGAIAALISDAFADEMDERGRAALRELRWMARLTPLVWWWARADPSFRYAFHGFVWEAPAPRGRGRRVVGTASLNQAPGDRQRWIICNVVVQDEHRGRGIGRKLVEAALAEARELGAAGVALQVYEDNPRALRLYTRLGFQEAAGETEMRLEAIRPVAFLHAPGYRLRPWRPADGQAAYELACLVTPSALQWLRPVWADQYRPAWWTRLGQRFSDLMAGRRVYRLTALREERLAAMMTVTAAFRRGEHHLALLVHPDHAGQVETTLVSRALHTLDALPPRPVQATVDRSHTAVRQVLRDYGFEEGRTLLTLRKDFSPRS